MAKVFYSIVGASLAGAQAVVAYSVVVFDTPTPDTFSTDCRLIPGLDGVQTSMLIAAKVLQDVVGRGHLVGINDIVSLTPIQ